MDWSKYDGRRFAVRIPGQTHMGHTPNVVRKGPFVTTARVFRSIPDPNKPAPAREFPEHQVVQCRQMFDNLATQLAAVGASMKDLVSVKITYVGDSAEMRDYAKRTVDSIWDELFRDPEDQPARSLDPGKLMYGWIACEAIAVVG